MEHIGKDRKDWKGQTEVAVVVTWNAVKDSTSICTNPPFPMVQPGEGTDACQTWQNGWNSDSNGIFQFYDFYESSLWYQQFEK